MDNKNEESPYRFVICACCVGLLFTNMGLLSTAFSTYFPYMREIRQFTNTQLYLLPTIRSVSTIVFTLFTEQYYRMLGLKKGILAALLCTGLGFFLLSVAPGFWLYEVSMVIFGFAYAMGATIPSSILIRQWFKRGTAGAMGVVTAGTGISFILLPMFISRLVPTAGLDMTLRLEAGIVLVLGAVIVLFIREAPGEGASAPAARTAGPGAPAKEGQELLTPLQKARLYVVFFLIGCLALTAASGLSMLYSTTGHSAETTSALLSEMGFVLLIGKPAYGLICDRIGSKKTNTLYCSLIILGTLMCCLSQDAPVWLLALTTCVFPLGCCISTVGMTVIAGDMSSEAGFRKNLKNLQFTYSLGGFASGTVPGIIADVTGSYIPAYQLFTVTAVLVLVLLIPLYNVPAVREKQAGAGKA